MIDYIYPFHVSGTLSASAQCYIERPADAALLAALEHRELCLVLAPRQTGKSSLMVRAAAKLKDKGINCGIVDLQPLGSQRHQDLWFGAVVEQIHSSLKLRSDSEVWWEAHGRLSPPQRFLRFIEKKVLTETTGDTVIFFDEIDAVLPLPFSDDFFAAIRSLHNSRAYNPVLEPLTFALLGVATPSAFIRDRARTPFNVGKLIELNDFEKNSVAPLLNTFGENRTELLDRIFYWTNGQPFLVQKLAAELYSLSPKEHTTLRVDDAVRSLYLEQEVEHDIHLKPIQDYLLSRSTNVQETLRIYRRILRGYNIFDNNLSPDHNSLKLAGLVKVEKSSLALRNRIYATVFDLRWVEDHTPNALPSLIAYSASVVLTQLPVIGGILIWWAEVRRNLLVSLTIILLYEVLLAGAAFSQKVLAKLENTIAQSTADRIRELLTNFQPGFVSRYKKLVIEDHGIFNVRGLGLINTYTLQLEQVFVNLRVAPSTFTERKNLVPQTRKKSSESHSIWEYLFPRVRNHFQSTALAIVGPPGCGKTTLLQHIATTLAANRQQRYSIRSYLPLIVFLRDHIVTITQERIPTLGELAQSYYGDSKVFPALNPPEGWFERQLKLGRFLILLDGLDEVAKLDERKIIASWIDKQVLQYPKCQFIVTSRPQGYKEAPLERAVILETLPFSRKQVHQFIKNWYLANEIKSSGNVFGSEVQRRATRDATDLLQRLYRLPSLRELTVNPLLLTMVAMVHRYRGALPGGRVELYAEICEVLLGRWRQARGLRDKLNSAQKLVVLRPLAAYMMDRKIRRINAYQARKIIASPLERVGILGSQVDNFLDELQASSGLVIESEAGYWSFAHLTFQEYLTACHWLEQQGINCPWRDMVDDSWWHETLRLYAAQGDATPLVQACLKSDTVTALTLAADCLENARELDLKVRQAVEMRLTVDLESSDYGRRSLAAEVYLSRRLKSLIAIDEEYAIDMEYLTCAEYQLFLDHRRKQNRYYQPDHWNTYTFDKDQSSVPIAGIRAQDAVAFCEWLTERTGDNVVYRLPTTEEAQKYPATSRWLGAWCKDGSTLILSGLAPAVEERYKNELLNLCGSRIPLLSPLYSALAIETNRIVERNFTREISLALARIFKNLFSGGSRSNFDLALNRYLSRAVTSASGFNLDPDIKLVRTRKFDLDSIRDRAQDLNIELNPILDTIEREGFFNTTGSSQETKDDSEAIVEWLNELSNDALAAAGADSVLAARQSQRNYLALFLEKAYLELEKMEELNVISVLQRALRRRKQSHQPISIRKEVLRLYWWLQIVMARERGILPCWEGIRIVREKV